MARKKSKKLEEPSSPAWMGTFGDMITLVLTLFVLLFSFSEIDAKKWEAIKSSFNGINTTNVDALDPFTVGVPFQIDESAARQYRRKGEEGEEKPEPSPSPSPGIDELAAMKVKQDFNDLYEKLQKHVSDEGLETTLLVEKKDGLISIQMDEVALFNTGKADIKPEAIEILTIIGDLIAYYDSSIRAVIVEGHTDNVYIYKPPFKSNWELSALRAVNVLRYFTEMTNLENEKFSAIAYGEFHPIATNDTEEGRAKNRRVELAIESMEPVIADGTYKGY